MLLLLSVQHRLSLYSILARALYVCRLLPRFGLSLKKFFLELSSDEGEKNYDLIIESYLNNDPNAIDTINKTYFSEIYGDWRLLIIDSNNNIFYDFQKKSDKPDKTKAVEGFVKLPVIKGEDDFEFIEVVLQIFK